MNGKLRTVPLEIMLRGDKLPLYGETMEEAGRFRHASGPIPVFSPVFRRFFSGLSFPRIPAHLPACFQ